MKINIDKLTEAELIELNQKIVERLRFLNQARAHVAMLEFKIGDQVSFVKNDGTEVNGMLTKYNKKTVTVITRDGQQWNVSPGFLTTAHKNPQREHGSNIVTLPMLPKSSS